MDVIKTKKLTKKYGQQLSVDHIDMVVKKGDIYGFIGRNGAGKSTTLKMISGLMRSTEGNIELFGKPVHDEMSRKRIGILIEEPGLYPNMNAYDNLELQALSLGITNKKRIYDVLALVHLTSAGKKKVKNYSMGMKQRLGIALALLGNPDLLILDEPINGLDPEGIKEIRETLIQLNKEYGMTIIISSHILGELSKLATTFGIIKDGQLIQQISKEELDEKCKEYLAVEIDNAQKACVILENIDQNIEYEVVNQTTLHIYSQLNSADVIGHLVNAGIAVISSYFHNQDLEEYFLSLMESGCSYD
ncbi:ABC transporter ATP-binding protein [Candidatus Stoquefichus massiliensis]|uniref:ABC transporter ATP-binding protein n=1 Tax=Candidatus Stoquefichus massiliensis TaxID=1470350 RepID=UPI0004811A81|nr:ABC transporter ATP-binding protein [Candidatus Stoquefichus massiliensis]